MDGLDRRTLIGLLAAAATARPARAAAPSFNVRDFGAQGDGVADDGPAIRIAQGAAQQVGGTVAFPAGTYACRGWSDVGDGAVRWRSSEGARILVHRDTIQFASRARTLVGVGGGARGAMLFAAADGPAARPGGIFHVAVRKVVERLRPDPFACQTALVRRGTAAGVTIDRPLLFDFLRGDDGLEARVYDQPRVVRMEGLTFVAAADNGVRALTLTGVAAGLAFDGCGIETRHAGDVNVAPDGVMVQESVGVAARMLSIRNCRYGYMISRGARDCTVDGVDSEANRHPLYPAYWAQGCVFSSVVGRGNVATLDSHAAFDTAYRGVTALDDLEMSNIRSAGATLIDARIRSRAPRSFLVAFQVWAPPYSDIALKHDVLFRNVRLGFGGRVSRDMPAITVDGAGRLVLDDVRSDPPGLTLAIPDDGRIGAVSIVRSNLRLLRKPRGE